MSNTERSVEEIVEELPCQMFGGVPHYDKALVLALCSRIQQEAVMSERKKKREFASTILVLIEKGHTETALNFIRDARGVTTTHHD